MYLSVVLYYLLAINLLTFVAYGHDKWKARHPHPHIHPRSTRKRTSEATLMLLAALGGSVGALLAMYLFRHKTLHKKFTLGIPLILVAQVVLAIVCAWLLTANGRAGRSGKTESAEVKMDDMTDKIGTHEESTIEIIKHHVYEVRGSTLSIGLCLPRRTPQKRL